MSSRRLAAGLALFALAAAAPATAEASGDPDLAWWTYETPHFRVHYPHTLEPIAARVAMLAESVRGRVSEALGHHPSELTNIVLTDDSEAANGSATAVPYNTIRLFVTAPDDLSPLGDYDDWMLDLVTHEYAHIAHTDNISGIPAIVNAVIGKSIAPNQIQPRWIIEGLAVVAETEHSSAGRLRSSLFDMHMRADVLADNLMRIDQFSNNPYRWPQGSAWYLYGSRFLSWVSDVYGKDTLRAVSADYGASIVPWGINRAIRRVTGRTYIELYAGFEEHLRRRYATQVKAVEARGVREGRRITHHGRYAFYPRFVPRAALSRPGALEVVYNRDDYNERPGIYRLDVGGAGEARHTELLARANGTSMAAFTPEGDVVWSSVSPFGNGYFRDDPFRLPRGARSPRGDEPERVRLSRGLRTGYLDVSPDGRRIVFTVNSMGTTRLQIAELEKDRISGRRDLVASARFEQAYTPRFSPDGRRVSYSAWRAGGFRDIRIVDVETGRVEVLTHDRAQDAHPAWSPDGRVLYWSSDRTGIFNVYAYDLEKRTTRQVTNERVGALCPAISEDGKTLVYVGYTTAGYDLFLMPLDPARFLPAPAPAAERPDPPSEPAYVPLRKSRYSPLPTLAPRTFSFEYKPGNFEGNALTLTARGSDVVGHHAVAATVVADTNAPSPALTLDYRYGRLPFDLGLRFFHTVAPRNGYRISDRRDPFVEYQNGITSSISYSLPHDFSASGFGLSYTVAHFQGDLPVGSRLDPYATRTVLPPSGVLGIVHLGYSFTSTEGVLAAPGPGRGFSLSLGVDFADTATGSDYTVRAFEASAAAYVPMPWPGYHTLALRAAGAISGGNYPRRGVYFVGGYDLERHDLIDTITSGVFDGAFVLRGYPPAAYIGREYLQTTAEYRLPILKPDLGLLTLPIFLRRVDAAAFVDHGGAFDEFDPRKLRLFHDGALLDSDQFHTSVGGELWASFVFGYGLGAQLRLGYAYGFSGGAIPGGQLYFVAASAF